MNDFYTLPLSVQWLVSILLLALGVYPVLILFDMAYVNPWYYLLLLVYIPIIQFCTTPFFKLTWVYTYYSPMLLGYMANDALIDLHHGSSFDYLFVMRKFNNRKAWRNRIMMYHLEGLLNLISQIENNLIPDTVTITGTSYFFNERTTHKLGFDMVEPTFFNRINLFVNFFDILWMHFIVKGRYSIPKIWSAKKAVTSGVRLSASKSTITELYHKLSEKS